MDSALSATSTQLALFKALNRHLCKAPPLVECISKQLHRRRLYSAAYNYGIPRPEPFSSLTTFWAAVYPGRCRLQCVSSSAGGGNGAVDGQDSKLAAQGAERLRALPTDVIILDVRGMMCGGCADNVKRILENKPQVSSANVNLTAETAIVWPISEAKAEPNWQKQLGEALAEHLTNCGFVSSPRGHEDSN